MTKSYIVEVGDFSAGIVVREAGERHFTFFASANPFWKLEGRLFASVSEAESAARALLRVNPVPA